MQHQPLRGHLEAARGLQEEQQGVAQPCVVLVIGRQAGPGELAWGVLDAAYLGGFSWILVRTDPAVSPGVIISDALTGGRKPRTGRPDSVRWILGHLPLTAAIAAMGAAMGAAMLSLIDHAHDGRTPAATAWLLCAGAAVVLGATMLVAAPLPDWDRDRGVYRPLARICAAMAVACVGLGAIRPAPLVLGLALDVLLSIPWRFAVARRLARPVPAEP